MYNMSFLASKIKHLCCLFILLMACHFIYLHYARLMLDNSAVLL
uniref:Uncharacterized protein n=1 Tax=Arundo donax TaxID=35708 RepID=A0A0A9C075_ARUDO